MMNENKVRGLAAFGAAGYSYMNMLWLSSIAGPIVPSIAIASGMLYGMAQFAERNAVTEIDPKENGFFTITYLVSPLRSETVTAHVNDMYSLCALGDDDLGA